MHPVPHHARVVLVAAACLTIPAFAGGQTLVNLKTTHAGVAVEGVGIVVRSDGASSQVLTAATLFRNDRGEPASDPVTLTADGRSVVVTADRVQTPTGDLTGVALVAVSGLTDPHGTAAALDYASPSLGGVFVIAGLVDGTRVDVPERIQFVATRLVVGNRPLSDLRTCLGAPALSPDGVFGIVTDCSPGRAPVVALVSTSRSFLSRHLSPPMTTSTPRPSFTVTERLLEGPLLTVACGEVNAGEMDVPFELPRGEKAIDASASILSRDSVRLADVDVVQFEDRRVRLHFTMVGQPPPPYTVPGTCRQGQALVSVRVNVVVVQPQ